MKNEKKDFKKISIWEIIIPIVIFIGFVFVMNSLPEGNIDRKTLGVILLMG